MTAPAKILTATEPWVEYQLEDGTTLRFRFTACNFRKTGKINEHGEPEYSFNNALLIETHSPAAEVVQLRAAPDYAPSEYWVLSSDSTEYCAPVEDCG